MNSPPEIGQWVVVTNSHEFWYIGRAGLVRAISALRYSALVWFQEASPADGVPSEAWFDVTRLEPFVAGADGMTRLRQAVRSTGLRWWDVPSYQWPAEMEMLRPDLEALVKQTDAFNAKARGTGIALRLEPEAL